MRSRVKRISAELLPEKHCKLRHLYRGRPCGCKLMAPRPLWPGSSCGKGSETRSACGKGRLLVRPPLWPGRHWRSSLHKPVKEVGPPGSSRTQSIIYHASAQRTDHDRREDYSESTSGALGRQSAQRNLSARRWSGRVAVPEAYPDRVIHQLQLVGERYGEEAVVPQARRDDRVRQNCSSEEGGVHP